MKKWIALLTFALLFNAACSRAETAVFYTNNEDRYYHADADCDRPMSIRWWDGAPQAYYERSIYQKYEISENAAAEFEKTHKVDHFVFGHYHCDVSMKTPGGASFTILKDWMSGSPYLAV